MVSIDKFRLNIGTYYIDIGLTMSVLVKYLSSIG